MALSDLALKIL